MIAIYVYTVNNKLPCYSLLLLGGW